MPDAGHLGMFGSNLNVSGKPEKLRSPRDTTGIWIFLLKFKQDTTCAAQLVPCLWTGEHLPQIQRIFVNHVSILTDTLTEPSPIFVVTIFSTFCRPAHKSHFYKVTHNTTLRSCILSHVVKSFIFTFLTKSTYCLDLRLLSRLKWIILSSGLLHGLRWFKTDVSVLPIRPVILDSLVLEDGTDRWFRNVRFKTRYAMQQRVKRKN